MNGKYKLWADDTLLLLLKLNPHDNHDTIQIVAHWLYNTIIENWSWMKVLYDIYPSSQKICPAFCLLIWYNHSILSPDPPPPDWADCLVLNVIDSGVLLSYCTVLLFEQLLIITGLDIMYAKTESEVSIQNKMGEVSEKQNLDRLQKVTLSVDNHNDIK